MIVQTPVHFDTVYDVIVVGFGGAGATAARFAADEGAKVLLLDSAPERHEGGNTRYSDQAIASTSDFETYKKFQKQLNEPFEDDEQVLDTYVEGLVNMKDYLKKYVSKTPDDVWDTKKEASKLFWSEFAELGSNADAYETLYVHHNMDDGELWNRLRELVVARHDHIDVWFESPARHLIQEAGSNKIVGVQVERDHVQRNIKATNGVVLASGGFENNKQMIADYLQEDTMAPVGTKYNKGIGITLALEAGADLWHMRAYEKIGQYHGMGIRKPEGENAHDPLKIFWAGGFTGSIFVVGDDGTRYFKEDEINKHGHLYNHGIWRVPLGQSKSYVIFDQKKFEQLQKDEGDQSVAQFSMNVTGFTKHALKADSIEELAAKINKDPEKLQQTLADFNFFAERGRDYAYNRNAKTMTKFADAGPYYAVAMRNNMLNTQGGARRNSRSEVVDPAGESIPHLYEAGELGAPFPSNYIAGGNLADCLISGKIAGQNAARVKNDAAIQVDEQGKNDTETENVGDFKSVSDIAEEHFATGPNQFIGKSDAGMGGELVVRVTLDDNHDLQNIEVLKQSETAEISAETLKNVPAEMIKAKSYDIDVTTEASRTVSALKDAVKKAVDQAKINNA